MSSDRGVAGSVVLQHGSTNLRYVLQIINRPQILKTKLKIWLLQQWLNHGNLPTRRELTSSE